MLTRGVGGGAVRPFKSVSLFGQVPRVAQGFDSMRVIESEMSAHSCTAEFRRHRFADSFEWGWLVGGSVESCALCGTLESLENVQQFANTNVFEV